ncbi:RNA polymerase factor sigma-54 [Luteimonas sp. RD2P54]|uniref:RNA polymerase sigma-54 factor n=1 Tax=Luteimonas endophytica TaxID=3042023 RepID=A0ABT6J7G4_9GAMM|nr:RNA polymerase factor sigma-54 [Luteimonas endophytica]MDH5822760.1 RNA polymerase factor sigma-54 [Luteimonas endophytica]
MKGSQIQSQQLGQQLNLTPQLLQAIRLLQLDSMQLEQEVRQALELNPLLELQEEAETQAAAEAEGCIADAAAAEVAAFDELPESSMWDVPAAGWREGQEDGMERIAAGGSSDPQVRILQDLALELAPAELEIAAFWLEHCDDAGYLDGEPEVLARLACARFDLPAARVEAVRQRLLHGDPAGIAAASLQECLQAQLAALPGPVAGRPLAARILGGCLDLLAAHDHAAIALRLGVAEEDATEAARLVLSLDPRPGDAGRPDGNVAVVPDAVAWFADGQWRVALNGATAPRVAVNPMYERALAGGGDDAGSGQLRALLQEARWLSRGLAMRYDTLLRTARVIVERQAGFLERGDEAMAPLTLKEVADAIGMHESTVSRITTGKYLQTPRGTIEMKRFFAVRLEGANVSGTAVRAMVKRLIDAEPPQRPLADDAIAELLARNGVHIARRTVAKYRDQLAIAPARQRRRGAPQPLMAQAG